jgi:NhaP-type Na+/H+ or K+/H+ antiporter
MLTGEMSPGTVISQFIASLVIALIIGIGGAILWSFILTKLPTLKSTKFSTPAFLFILYGITEYLQCSGPITALSFGIAIGNLFYFEPKFIERIAQNPSIVLPKSEKDFFSEIIFLLRIFFFVFIGINLKLNRPEWLMWGAIITLALVVVRILMVKFVSSKDTPVLDKAVMSVMIPKGLGAAVMATLPLYQGVAFGEVIQAICYSIILFSTMYCVLLFFMIRTDFSMPFYRLIYKEPAVHST